MDILWFEDSGVDYSWECQCPHTHQTHTSEYHGIPSGHNCVRNVIGNDGTKKHCSHGRGGEALLPTVYGGEGCLCLGVHKGNQKEGGII